MVHVTYLFTRFVTKSCDSPDWLIQSSYQSASSCVSERLIWPGHLQNVLVILSLNTVKPNHFYGLAIKGDSMSPQMDYL